MHFEGSLWIAVGNSLCLGFVGVCLVELKVVTPAHDLTSNVANDLGFFLIFCQTGCFGEWLVWSLTSTPSLCWTPCPDVVTVESVSANWPRLHNWACCAGFLLCRKEKMPGNCLLNCECFVAFFTHLPLLTFAVHAIDGGDLIAAHAEGLQFYVVWVFFRSRAHFLDRCIFSLRFTGANDVSLKIFPSGST